MTVHAGSYFGSHQEAITAGFRIAWHLDPWAMDAIGPGDGDGAWLDERVGQATFQLRSPSRATTSMLPPSAET